MGKKSSRAEAIESREASWQEVVLLCGKCGGKLKGGFGEKGRDGLRDALRDTLRETGRRRDVRLVETGCLGVCPRDAVVALRGADPARLLIVPPGQPGGAVLAALGVKPNRLP